MTATSLSSIAASCHCGAVTPRQIAVVDVLIARRRDRASPGSTRGGEGVHAGADRAAVVQLGQGVVADVDRAQRVRQGPGGEPVPNGRRSA
ncbi:hypothetical protein [Saccharothrix deserti]|uniref:hypothetical protein n=1 Tax=Saccharothrix deserti TaxID=2593674 RepID=UPI00131DF9C3|nr:hypothetical protein [Saccharothrix deserti]